MQLKQNKKNLQKPLIQCLSRFLERGIFAPFLLAVQSVLYLYLLNSAEVYFAESVRAILLSILFGIIVLGLTYLFIHHWLKASLIASLFIFLFFLFGDISDWIMKAFGLHLLQADLIVMSLVTVYMILWIWLVQNRLKNIASVNLYFNLLSIVLLIYSGISVSNSELGNQISIKRDSSGPQHVIESSVSRPDIYYIILDAYGREDILSALYSFDNSNFLNALKTRNFYIAEEATSNYVQTMLSVSSALNMDYLQSLKAEGASIENRRDLGELLENNKVRNALAQNGYQLISFRNMSHVGISSAEIYCDDIGAGLAYPLSAFESMVINRTLVRVLFHVPFFNKVLTETPYDTHRSQILTTLERLKKTPSLDGDYFIYAHILAPHPPFVFDENGDALSHDEPFTLSDGNNYVRDHSRESFVTGYRKQISYVNKIVLETVDVILATSDPKPIIVIQGDHGPGSQFDFTSLENTLPAERFSILNAYYFPDQDYTRLYPSISPVNSFRVVLNHFFGGTYDLIPDDHHYSTWSCPFDFVEVKDLSLPSVSQD
jgi:hypothetical protein